MKFLIGLVVLIVVIVGGYFFLVPFFSDLSFITRQNITEPIPQPTNVVEEDIPLPSLETRLTLSDLAEQSAEGNCLVGYEGVAYSINGLLEVFPNFSDIFSPLCGTVEEFTIEFSKLNEDAKKMVLLDTRLVIPLGELDTF